ncbi:hypothetical protein RJ641_034041, partial [Dillenia turbinata]
RMGVSLSCPFASLSDLESGLKSVVVKYVCLGDNEWRTPLRSISFKGQDSEPTIMQSSHSGEMVLEGSVSFRIKKLEKMIPVKVHTLNEEQDISSKSNAKESKEMTALSPRSDCSSEVSPLALLDLGDFKHEAALKLQKVYKSFRTRRKLADCAVLVEQSWWKLLDFAELKRSSISFFDIEKHESAISRWSRARTRAAKVGKGLSKNDKARKLALQHWLEAIDPRHRYGHNLHFYYVKWLHCQSRQPFFYWLDIGEGKEVNLVEKCPRSKLQQQCIKYLGPMERKAYEVVVEDGKMYYKQSGELINTTEEHKDSKWIFVLSTSRVLYVGKKKKGTFQHSSFLAGGATSAAGRLVVENGVLKVVWPHSGHYRPTEENFQEFLSFLRDNNVDLTDVKMSPVDDDNDTISRKSSSVCLRSSLSVEDLTRVETTPQADLTCVGDLNSKMTDSMEQENTAVSVVPKSRMLRRLSKKLSKIEIPKRDDLFERCENTDPYIEQRRNNSADDSRLDGYEMTEEVITSDEDYLGPKQNMFEDAEEHEEIVKDGIPEEAILQRINSHKGTKSFQLGKQLSCKWTTGAGPRIGCVRDYPSELQARALEQVNLSPRSASRLRCESYFSPRIRSGLSPKLSEASIHQSKIQSSSLWKTETVVTANS